MEAVGNAISNTESVNRLAAHVRSELGKIIVGQEATIDQFLLVILCSGHGLVEGVPGLAKTLAVKALARLLQLEFQRVQCTADLMPADVLGANIFNVAAGSFALHRGPVFTDLLLVDEINRTPPRTQAALLESMEERQVTLDGARHPLSNFFTVFATQNPVEFEGTYPLPEAQLDRFLMKILVSYPAAEQEAKILENYQNGFDARELERVGLVPVDSALLAAARAEVAQVKVEPALFRYIATLVRRTREWPSLSLGASPRAAISLMMVSKAMAAMDGRGYLIPDDVKSVAPPVLRHRIMLKPEADLEGVTADQVIRDVIAAVEVPK
jgi:MoxR-like ATPase